MQNPQIKNLLKNKHVMLLQGPMGYFFAEFADWLNNQGIETHKINFNGGDWFFYRKRANSINFNLRMGQFKQWFKQQVHTRKIEAVVCFGDCRKQHRVAKEVCDELGLGFYAFEEGYIRPNYITFEADGVNFFSNFLNFLNDGEEKTKNKPPVCENIASHFNDMIRISIIYYLFWFLFLWLFPFYRHHRGIGPVLEAFYWIRSGIRRLINKRKETEIALFVKKHHKQYFLFTLQVHNDFQLLVHSKKKRMELYIAEVIESFANHAPLRKMLVIKHHPMDRGYTNYEQLIEKLAQQYNIGHRILYCCDTNLPAMIRGSLGMVTVNSTTGLQSLFHNVPVKLLGDAIYNTSRLTVQHSLNVFWIKPTRVDHKYYEFFRMQLILFSQLNGSFHGDNPWMKLPALPHDLHK